MGWGVGGGYVEGSFHRGICHRERLFSIKGAPYFPALLKKRSEIKKKTK